MRNRFEAFAGSVVELNRCLQRIKDIEMRKLGLRAGHAMCLYYLGQNEDGLTAAELTELCREDKAAVSRCVRELMEKELLYGRVPENKRSYRTKLKLTESGRALVDKIQDRIVEALFSGGSGLTDQQRENFYESMERILRNLSQYIREQEEATGTKEADAYGECAEGKEQ